MTATKGKENQKSQSLAGSESPIQQVQGTGSVHDLNEAEQTPLNSLLKTSEEIGNMFDDYSVIIRAEDEYRYEEFAKKQWFPAEEVRVVIDGSPKDTYHKFTNGKNNIFVSQIIQDIKKVIKERLNLK